MPQAYQTPGFKLTTSPTSRLSVLIGGQYPYDGIARTHVRSKSASQSPVPCHLSPKLDFSLAGEMFR